MTTRRWLAVGLACIVPAWATAAPRLLATINSTNQIRQYSISGQFIGSYAAPNGPRKMVLGADGVLYVAKQDGNTVDRYVPTTGVALGAFPMLNVLSAPNGLEFWSGALLVGSQAPNRIAAFSPTGVFGGFLPTDSTLGSPNDFAIGPDGDLFVLSSDEESRVVRFSRADGSSRGVFTSGGGPFAFLYALTFGPDGNLYACGSDSYVIRFDGRTGDYLDVFVPAGSGGLDAAADLVFGPDGNLYVASFQGKRILRFDGRTGAFLDEFADTAGQVDGLLFVDPNDTCGNGVVGPGEQCDAGAANGTSGSCCTAQCTFASSGTTCRAATGICDAAESCSGFSGLCPADGFADGVACDDGDPCTITDVCAHGDCTGHVPVPGSACSAARRASLRIGLPAKASKRALVWRWTAAAPVATAAFGNPVGTTPLAFCLLSGATPVARLVVPPGNRWTSSKKGFTYADPAHADGSVGRVALVSGAAGRGQIAVMGSGATLSVPLPLTSPLTARLQRGDGGACWESALTTTRNDARHVKAHGTAPK